MLGTLEQITKIVMTISDRDSASAARPELKKAAEKMLVLRKKADQLKQPNQEEKNRLEKEYAPRFEGAVKNLRDATVHAKSIPGGEEALTELAILAESKEADKAKLKKDK